MRGAKQKEMFEISDLRREILHLRSVCLSVWGGGGGVLLYFHAFVGSGYFWGFKIFEFQYLGGGGGGGGQKTEYFWGYEDFVDIFGVITKLDTMHFRVFSEGQGTKWRIFFELLKFQILIWGAWNSWYFLGVPPSVQTYPCKMLISGLLS